MTAPWTEQANQMFKVWSETQKAWLETLSRPVAGAPALPAMMPHAQGFQEAARQVNEAWKSSVEQWMDLLKQGDRFTASQEHLRKIFDPAEWAKPLPGSFDFGIERIIDGPNFATLWDLDRKVLKVQQLGMRRAEDSAAYHAVVFAAWNRAVERFTRELAERKGGEIGSYRELIDRWIGTANETLLELHRSQEFLEAQRRVTRSATEFRLAEREVAEAYCEMQHIPTRSEVDELARAVQELRRDVRALTRRFDAAPPADDEKPPHARRPRKASKASKGAPTP
jgi:hypothetical protein